LFYACGTFAKGETRLGLRSKHQGRESAAKRKRCLIAVRQASDLVRAEHSPKAKQDLVCEANIKGGRARQNEKDA